MRIFLVALVFSLPALADVGLAGYVCKESPEDPTPNQLRLETHLKRKFVLEASDANVEKAIRGAIDGLYCGPIEVRGSIEGTKFHVTKVEATKEVGLTPGFFLISGIGWGNSEASQEIAVRVFDELVRKHADHLRARHLNGPGDLTLAQVVTTDYSFAYLREQLATLNLTGMAVVLNLSPIRLNLGLRGSRLTLKE